LTVACEQGSPDLKAAREVANYIGTVHKEFHFTVQVCPFSDVLDSLFASITLGTFLSTYFFGEVLYLALVSDTVL
jgi:hypothetical protein